MCRPVAIQGRSNSMLLARPSREGGKERGQGGARAWPAQEGPWGREVVGGLGSRKPHHLQGPQLPRGLLPTCPDDFC